MTARFAVGRCRKRYRGAPSALAIFDSGRHMHAAFLPETPIADVETYAALLNEGERTWRDYAWHEPRHCEVEDTLTTNHDDRGARGITKGTPMTEKTTRSSAAAVVEHDFDHIHEEASRVELSLFGAPRPDNAAINAASTIERSAKQFAQAVAAGHFTDPQLVALKELPRMLGKALETIDPERAR